MTDPQSYPVTEAMVDAAVAAIDEFPFSNGPADDRAPMRAALEAALRTGGVAQAAAQPVCDLCDAPLMCAACGHEQRPAHAQAGTDPSLQKMQISPWQPIETAPKDGTRILVLLKDPLPAEGRDDLKGWYGVPFVARHWGVITESGFDIGWQFAAPVGQGGFPDSWMVGWQPISSVSSTDREGK